MSEISAANLRGAVDLSSLVRPQTPASPGAASSPAATASSEPVPVPSLVVEATDATFTVILELSSTVPVIVEFFAGEPGSSLPKAVAARQGRFLLATVDATANPQLRGAFSVNAVPTVAAVIAGRPVPLFEGELPADQIEQLFDQILELSAQNGVTGSVVADAAGEETAEPVEEPLPPLHQEAFDAVEAADYPRAIAAYEKAIAQDPRDELAVAGLAQVALLHRLSGRSAAEIREAAGAEPTNAEAQMAVADLDLSGGHLTDAFDRLLDLYPSLGADDKNAVRQRLLDYFQVAGVTDPRVVAARRRLTALLY